MQAPPYQLKPSIRSWLGDIQPAWTLLDPATLSSLYSQPSPSGRPITLAKDFSIEEIGQSAVARNALMLLSAASRGQGLKLTATGNLTRKVVAEMFEVFTWPGLDKADLLRYHKVLNEPDFLPLYFVRHLLETAGLVHQNNNFLTISPNGLFVLQGPTRHAFQALLFHVAFWLFDLNYFGRGLPDDWPQRDIGVVLWSLSVSTSQWCTPEYLSKSCTIPTEDIIAAPRDIATYAMEARILRPLLYFGLLEQHSVPHHKYSSMDQSEYRKSALFDRFLSFNVKLRSHTGPVH